MEKTSFFGAILVMLLAIDAYAAAAAHVYSSRLIHRFSEEVRRGGGGEGEAAWPEGKRVEHMRVLLESDLKRQRLKLGTQNQVFVGSQGGETFNYGNDMGWRKIIGARLLCGHVYHAREFLPDFPFV